MMLSLDTAYRSFGGEVEALSTPTICRLPDSRRHQLSAIAPPKDVSPHRFSYSAFPEVLNLRVLPQPVHRVRLRRRAKPSWLPLSRVAFGRLTGCLVIS